MDYIEIFNFIGFREKFDNKHNCIIFFLTTNDLIKSQDWFQEIVKFINIDSYSLKNVNFDMSFRISDDRYIFNMFATTLSLTDKQMKLIFRSAIREINLNKILKK